MSWVATSISLATTMYAGHEQASNQNALSKQNWKSSVESMTHEVRGMNEAHRESQEIAQDNKLMALLQNAEAQSTLQAGERNVAGGSAEGMSKMIDNSLVKHLQGIQKNMDGQARQLEMEKKGRKATAQNRINSMPTAKYNPMGDIVQAGLGIYGGYKSANRDFKKHNNGAKLSFRDYARGDWS